MPRVHADHAGIAPGATESLSTQAARPDGAENRPCRLLSRRSSRALDGPSTGNTR